MIYFSSIKFNENEDWKNNKWLFLVYCYGDDGSIALFAAESGKVEDSHGWSGIFKVGGFWSGGWDHKILGFD